MNRGPLERVLLVDDDDDVRTVASMALELVGGLTVRACTGGEQALAAIPEFAPQIALLDVMMPGMDGPALLARLRADPATAGLPVAFMTAKAQPAEIAELLALGAVEVFAKPFDPMTLADSVKALWARLGA